MHRTSTRASEPSPARRNAAVRSVTAALTSPDREYRPLQEAHPAPGMPERLNRGLRADKIRTGTLANARRTHQRADDRGVSNGQVVRAWWYRTTAVSTEHALQMEGGTGAPKRTTSPYLSCRRWR